jgi:hypothetical protein
MSGRAARAAKRRKALAKAPVHVYQSGGFLVIHAAQLQWIDANDMPKANKENAWRRWSRDNGLDDATILAAVAAAEAEVEGR